VSGSKQTALLETTQWLAFEQSHLVFLNDFILEKENVRNPACSIVTQALIYAASTEL